MEFRVLGPLEAREGDQSLPLGGAKQRALLALLLLNGNRVVSRERLVDELWGGDPPARAVETVQVYVSRLRKLLPDGRLATRPPGYVLRVEPDELDLDRFERLREAGRPRDALELWRGPPLSELPLERARLEDLRLAVLEERVEADLEQGRDAELVGELELLVAEEPHREGMRALLMLALYRSGRQADALAAYRDARAALDELGIEPSGRLRALERAILSQDSALDRRAADLLRPGAQLPLPGPLVPESPFPFVGRMRELADLRVLLERAANGEGALVLVTGEPGAGKTRLVRQFAREAAGRGTLVLYGVSDAVVSTPYQPLREWLRFLVGVCAPAALRVSLGGQGAHLARLVPELSRLTGIATESIVDVETDRYLLQGAAVELLARISRTRPIMLVADDLHWADDEMLALLRRLARAAPETRLLIVAGYRDPGEEITPQLADTLADFARLDAVNRITLQGLGPDEIAAFVHESADADASSELTSTISELTDGTPLLVCELWRDLRETGSVTVTNGDATLSRPVGELRGTERIGELIQQRLARLAVGPRTLIEYASAAGPRFELRVVADAAQLEPNGLIDALEEAQRSGVIEQLPATTPTGRFTHELVRRAVYDRIRGIRRAELHLRIGEALERLHTRDLDRVLPELAHHFTLAAPLAGVERAVDYNLRAAKAATVAAAHSEAAARLATTLELGIDDPRERTRVQVELGHLLYEAGQMVQSTAVLAASLDAATSIEEHGLATHALVHRLIQQMVSDPAAGSTEIVPIAEGAIGTFKQLGDSLGLAYAERLLADALVREGRTAEGFAASERALAHADDAGDRATRRTMVGMLCRQVCDGPTPAGEGIERLEKLRASSRDDPVLEAVIRQCLALLLAMAGRFDESRVHILASVANIEGARESLSLPVRWMVADAKELAGDYAGAERDLTAQFLSMRDARGDEPESRALRAAATLALLCGDQGRWDEAAGYLSYGKEVDHAEPVVAKVYTALRLAARGRLAAHRGDLAEALRLSRRGVEIAERKNFLNLRARVWVGLAEVERAAGHSAESDTAVARALELYQQKGNLAAVARLRERGLTAPPCGPMMDAAWKTGPD